MIYVYGVSTWRRMIRLPLEGAAGSCFATAKSTGRVSLRFGNTSYAYPQSDKVGNMMSEQCSSLEPAV